MPDQSSDREKAKLSQAMKSSVMKKVYSDLHQEQKKHLDTLIKQGEYLKFAEQEKLDPSWNIILYNLPFFLNKTFIDRLALLTEYTRMNDSSYAR